MKSLRALFVVATASMALAMAHAQGKPLGVGDPAPKFEVETWVKGKPFKIEKGKAYIVEFWATWCGPCKATIPHLSELAKKFKGKIDVVGVSLFEHKPAYVDLVKAFVKEMGDKMDYAVGTGPDGSGMSKTWMDAAQQQFIPTAFVINKDSKIAFIGSPTGLDENVLNSILGGKLIPSKSAAAAPPQPPTQAQKDMQAALGKVSKAMEAKDAAALDSSYFEFIKKYPATELGLAEGLFTDTLEFDEKLAYKIAKHATEGMGKDQPIFLNQIAWAIVEHENKWKTPDYKYALDLASRAAAATQEEDYNILDTWALAHWRLGNKKDAVFVQEKAVKAMKADPNAAEDTKKELMERLELYRKG